MNAALSFYISGSAIASARLVTIGIVFRFHYSDISVVGVDSGSVYDGPHVYGGNNNFSSPDLFVIEARTSSIL